MIKARANILNLIFGFHFVTPAPFDKDLISLKNLK